MSELNRKAFEDLIKVAAHGGPINPQSYWVEVAPPEAQSGLWYFAVECPSCKRTTPFVRDFSNGKLGRPFSGNGGVLIPCRFCPTKIRAAFPQIEAIQWA